MTEAARARRTGSIMALLGVVIYLVGSAFPHTRAGSRGFGTAITFLPGYFSLWRFLFFVAIGLTTSVAAVRLARGAGGRWEAGALIGVGGLLVVSSIRQVLSNWIVEPSSVRPAVGGFAVLVGSALVLAGGIRALGPGSGARLPFADRLLLVTGALAVAARHLLPTSAMVGGVARPDIDLSMASTWFEAPWQMLDGPVGMAGVALLVALGFRAFLAGGAVPATVGALAALGIIELAIGIQALRLVLVSPNFTAEPGLYPLLLGSAALVVFGLRGRVGGSDPAEPA